MASEESNPDDVGTADVAQDEVIAEAAAVTVADTHLVDLPLVTSDAELSFDEALTLTGRTGARLVVPMGEIGVGKTTIMVELWTQLVGVESIDGYRCAGSRTVMAFEERAYLSRMAAGVGRRSTARTHYNDNEGLLDLRVVRPDGVAVHLLLADYSGERYERIREGAGADTEIAWLPRADRILIVVNGGALRAKHTAEVEIDRATRLLHAATAARLVASQTRIAIAIARDDELDNATFDVVRPRIERLLELAAETDEHAELLRIAARPRSGDPPYGFGALLNWMCSDSSRPLAEPVELPIGERSIARLREQG